MDFNSELNRRISVILTWLSENNIGSTKDKRNSIAREMFWCAIDAGVEDDDIVAIKQALKDRRFDLQPGNLWESLQTHFVSNPRYGQFLRRIAELTPVGLNTSPNACCGKYELLVRLILPSATQPNKGDILYEGQIYEIKGCDVRIQDTSLTGKTYKTNCDGIFRGQIEGNVIKTGGLSGTVAYEIEKRSHREYYKPQFDKDIPKSMTLLSKYLEVNGWHCTEEEVARIFCDGDGGWNQDAMNKLILVKMFIKYKTAQGFDKMYVFGDGTDVKVICDPSDLEQIRITKDFFRINQTEKVGWYI